MYCIINTEHIYHNGEAFLGWNDDIVKLLDTDDGVIEEYTYRELLHMLENKLIDIKGLQNCGMSRYNYRFVHIESALNHRLAIQMYNLYYRGRLVFATEVYNNERVSLVDSNGGVWLTGEFVFHNRKQLRHFYILWLEKIGSLYRVMLCIEERNDVLGMMPMIGMSVIFDKEKCLGIEHVYCHADLLYNVDVLSDARIPRSLLSRLQLTNPFEIKDTEFHKY